MKRYVNIIAVSEDGEHVVVLHKRKGPAHLLGKITVPGGQIDESDASAAQAGARELAEETGIVVAADQLVRVAFKGNSSFELTTFAVQTDISMACQQPGETEPIEIQRLPQVLQFATSGDERYVSDLAELLQAALSRLDVPASATAKALRP